jgi:cytochrome c biogenesis protein CcmG/thiol:disulfide interchange protein DsbE
MLRYLLLVAAFAGLVIVFSIGLQRDPSELPSPYIGNPAPAFDLPTLADPERRFANETLAGEVSLVNVWATWCVGCRQEHGFLMELAQSGRIPIYGINWRDNRADALRWLAQYGDPYVMSGFDGDGRAGIDWGVYGAPETFLVNAEGRVLYRHTGPLDAAVWQADFEPLLAASGGGQ